MKDKLIELENAGVIVHNVALNCYVYADQNPDPIPFDLSVYLFDLHAQHQEKQGYYTQAQKEIMYEYGDYHFAVPPVSTAFWTKKAWMNYIDANGTWGTCD